VFDFRIYELIIKTGDQYPDKQPIIHFIIKLYINCVDNNGNVNNKLTAFNPWKPSYSINDCLKSIKNEMTTPQNKKANQPPEGTM
jgi:ubiquitin-protein ligase